MVEKNTEADIISGLKNNDSRVCKSLFDKYYAPLLYFAEGFVGDTEEAEDIVIQVFNKFWAIRDNFETVTNIKAFLYIATKNVCFNMLRHQKRQQEGKKQFTAYLNSIEQADEIERQVIASEFLQRVYREVQNLPDKCKHVFLLTYFEGLTAGEIADRLNITVSTVTTQRSRALKYLKNILSAEDYFLLCFLFSDISYHLTDLFLHSAS